MSKEMDDVELGTTTSRGSSSAAPSSPMVAVKGLSYTVKKDLKILDNVTTMFETGQLTALMGGSGAGKTSLLDLIAGRRSTRGRGVTTEGTILFAGARPNDVVRKRYAGYCEQFDTLVSVLTVRETLECTAELKCSARVSTAVKKARVQEVMQELGIQKIAESLVGSPVAAKSISGGERKRVNIAVSLITKPAVLMLDEPTTGLDSATADDVLAVVASLARDGGRAIAATLHSPSSKAFRLSVDKVLCLGRGGRVVYSGSPKRGPLVAHLDSVGAPAFVEGDSLADHMMTVFGGGVAAKTGLDESFKASEEYARAWRQSPAGTLESERIDATTEAADGLAEENPDDAAARVLLKAAEGSLAWDASDPRRNFAVATSMVKGVTTLLRYRSWRSYCDPEYIAARLGDKVMYGFILATLWWGEGAKQRPEASVQNVAGLLWFLTIMPGYGAAVYVPQLVIERPVFLREVNDGCYASYTFLVAKIIEEFVVILPFSLAYSGCVYGAVSLQGSFWPVFLVTYLLGCWGVAIAYYIASVSPNADAANAILPTYVTVNIVFAGYIIIISDIPPGWRWYPWLDPMFYGWNALMKNNFQDTLVPFGDANDVKDYYGLRRLPSVWASIAILVLFLAVFLLLAAHALHKLASRT
mmetsp:Transcript_26237/g.84909  ORF Transcript_26237/g.84909 Transcript_26237/m.84909 type:complete len:643 (+) Transcript_26237:1911-3839(+)